MREECIHRILQWCCSAYEVQSHLGRWGLYQSGKSVTVSVTQTGCWLQHRATSHGP